MSILGRYVEKHAAPLVARVRDQAERAAEERFAGKIQEYQHVQELLAKKISDLNEETRLYVGNDYRSYETAVAAISNKYNCIAEWGNLQAGVCIDLRAAFVLGEGVQVHHTTQTRAEAVNELKWVKDFFSYNGFDSEMTQEIAKEAEIEGKVALRIAYDEYPYRTWPGMITTRFISWTSKRYEIEVDPLDYLDYIKLKWKPTGKDPGGEIPQEGFVYKKFGGRINAPNEAQPVLMRCLTQIDRLDKALWDLRRILHLFASPTPHIQVDNPAEITKMTERIDAMNWKIGKFLVHIGAFSMTGPDAAGIELLIREIETNAKMISGATGIPIHYLGLLDLLHNRATGDNTRELVMAATARERMIWKGAFEELIVKGMEMFNREAYGQKSTRLDPYKIKVEIPMITQEHWDRIADVLIPAAAANIVSKEHVASQIPGIDMDKESKIRTERDTREAERAQADLEALRLRMRLPGHPGEEDEE